MHRSSKSLFGPLNPQDQVLPQAHVLQMELHLHHWVEGLTLILQQTDILRVESHVVVTRHISFFFFEKDLHGYMTY